MVTTNFKLSGILSIAFLLCFFGVILFMIYFLAFRVIWASDRSEAGHLTPVQAILLLLFFCLIFAFYLFVFIRYAIVVRIDPDTRTIRFKNVLTQLSQTYSFDDFDGFLDTFAQVKAGNFKCIYLLKGKKAVRVIAGLYYDNMDEIQEALSPIKYLGFHANSAEIGKNALLKKPVID